jgi:hypothetical protein
MGKRKFVRFFRDGIADRKPEPGINGKLANAAFLSSPFIIQLSS